MAITLTLQDFTTRTYDLSIGSQVSVFKRMVTTAIKKKKTQRLREAERQLEQEQTCALAKSELKRIQKALGKQTPAPIQIPTPAQEPEAAQGPEPIYEPKALISDFHYFPRCEYYVRFNGSTAFSMTDPGHFSTYHRSQACRMFSAAGGRKGTQYSSPCTKKRPQTTSYAVHSGNILSPFSTPEYQAAFTLQRQASESLVNIRDHSLIYRHQMAKLVVESFAQHALINQQKIKKGTTPHFLRPIVYVENQYPCVLIALPALNPLETTTEATTYWAAHPKPFQQMLISSLLAFINAEAFQENIPIEIVLRSSFGHNLPSLCQTGDSFRINTGIIPAAYAALIGKALHKLNQLIQNMGDDTTAQLQLDDAFHATVRHYNARKLKEKISKNDRYEKLREEQCFKQAERSEAKLLELYQKFDAINKVKGTTGSSIATPVRLRGTSIWQAIRRYGDSDRHSVLYECFRKKSTTDWFADQVLDALLRESQTSIEDALTALIKCMRFGDTASMDYVKIRRELRKPKRNFKSLSFKPFYNADPNFDRITNLLFEGFETERPDFALYAELEHAGSDFYKTARGSAEATEDADYGSDSECEGDLTDTEEAAAADQQTRAPRRPKRRQLKHKFFHKKLRVCSGMKAILVAQYAALTYLRTQGHKVHSQEIKHMYYEVEQALKLVEVTQITLNKVRATIGSKILHFDLNHCNASNSSDGKTLKESLKITPSIVLLDYTSATQFQIKQALRQCYACKGVQVVFLVDSDLKNSQGGQDINPYGEVRVSTRQKRTTDTMFEIIKRGLGEKDKLPQVAHEKVRASKRRGFAYSLMGHFQTHNSQHEPVDEAMYQTLVPITAPN